MKNGLKYSNIKAYLGSEIYQNNAYFAVLLLVMV